MVKYDVSVEPELPPQDLKVGGNIKGLFLHGDGRYGSEVFFVPRNTVGKDIQEDDGYLICFVHDENIGYGYFNIVPNIAHFICHVFNGLVPNTLFGVTKSNSLVNPVIEAQSTNTR